MKIALSHKADKDYQRLPLYLQKKADKQLMYLLENYRHPSLRTKKMKGENYFEGRIDYQYRFTFLLYDDCIYVLSIGPHDEGLGKK